MWSLVLEVHLLFRRVIMLGRVRASEHESCSSDWIVLCELNDKIVSSPKYVSISCLKFTVAVQRRLPQKQNCRGGNNHWKKLRHPIFPLTVGLYSSLSLLEENRKQDTISFPYTNEKRFQKSMCWPRSRNDKLIFCLTNTLNIQLCQKGLVSWLFQFVFMY